MHLRALALVCAEALGDLPPGMTPELSHKAYWIVLHAYMQTGGDTSAEDMQTCLSLVFARKYPQFATQTPEHVEYLARIVNDVYARGDVRRRTSSKETYFTRLERTNLIWAYHTLYGPDWDALAQIVPGHTPEAVSKFMDRVLALQETQQRARKRRRSCDEENAEEARSWRRRLVY